MRQAIHKLLGVVTYLLRQIRSIRLSLVLWARARDGRVRLGAPRPRWQVISVWIAPAPVAERNGFTLLDITPDNVRMRLFAWRRENSSLTDIDALEPYHDVKIKKQGFSI